MSDSDDNCSNFERLAASKFASQADLSDDDSVFFSSKPKTKLKAKVENDDDDLTKFAEEIQGGGSGVDQSKINKLRVDIAKWEAVRVRAQLQNADQVKIDKVIKKIRELNTEVEHLSRPTLTMKQEKEITKLEQDIKMLEQERCELDSRISIMQGRLRQLKPHRDTDDWSNDPSQLGGRVVGNKFIEDKTGDDDYEQLALMIAKRRIAAQSSGQYNSDSHVRIRNPAPTRDLNPGFR